MKVLLEGLLPRLYPDLPFLCVTFSGKQDLERGVPRKLRAWREPGVKFVVLRDNDGEDCQGLKERLCRLCEEGGRADALVRIACQELEAWYLGDPAALAEAFGEEGLRRIGARARFRNPDTVVHPSAEVLKLIPEFQKVSGARRVAPYLGRNTNASPSFQALLRGLDRFAQGTGAQGSVGSGE